MFSYNRESLLSEIADVIQQALTPDVWQWLDEKAKQVEENASVQPLMIAFAAMPRKTGKAPVSLSASSKARIQQIRPGLSLEHWTIDRLSRAGLLMRLDPRDKDKYIRTIENLFLTAEMHEQVALYSTLPLLAYPDAWRGRCAEGIRSNIGDVLESIMCDNPYPAENLDEAAWNQLVLKAIFTEKPIHRIVKLDERANQRLANTLSDYAHERWAARRTVNPLLWRCVGPFINEAIFPDIQRIARAEHIREREAAALACAQSNYSPARALLANDPELKGIVESGLTWHDVATKTEGVS